MKTFRLKTIGAIVLAVIVAGTALIFWPGQEQDITVDSAGPESQQPRHRESNPEALKLYQTALRQVESGDFGPDNVKTATACCRQIIEEYPDSIEADEARALLRELQWSREYARQMSYRRSEPKVKRSRTLRHRIPRSRR